MVDPWDMARTDEPKTAPEVRPLGVTVLPSFEAAPRLKPVAEPELQPGPAAAAVPPVAAHVPTPAVAEPTQVAHAGAHLHAQDARGARALLRRRPGRAPLVAVPEPAEAPAVATVPPSVIAVATVPPSVIAVAPLSPVAAPPATPGAPSLELIQAELRQERERADSAEAANAVLRRRLAQLDDELAQFRPRAIVAFEDNTD